MSGVLPIAAAGLAEGAPQLTQLGLQDLPILAAGGAAHPAAVSFETLLSSGLASVNRKVAAADELVRQFALDDSIPVHRVTIALEEARLSLELAMQVRARLVETYRELMTMQL